MSVNQRPNQGPSIGLIALTAIIVILVSMVG